MKNQYDGTNGNGYQPLPVEPAPARDEREAELLKVFDFCRFVIKCVYQNGEYAPASTQEPREIETLLSSLAITRPAQTAPQPEQGDMMLVPKQFVVFVGELADMVIKGEALEMQKRTAGALLQTLQDKE